MFFDLDGFIQDGFHIKGFDKYGFNKKGFEKDGFDRNEEKIIKVIRENPWNIYSASHVFRNNYKTMKDCVKSDPKTYQYATLCLNQNVDLA